MALRNVKVILLLVGQLILLVMADYGDIYYDFYSKLGTEEFLPAKSCAEIYHINKASRGRSGYYWIKTTDVYQVYCDMELECGDQKGGWMRIYSFDTSVGHSCPVGWYKHETLNLCTGKNLLAGCYSAYFPSYDVNYKRVCGMVKAYQKGTTNAFYPTSYFLGKDKSITPDKASASIDGVYVDGISITFWETSQACMDLCCWIK